MSTAIEIRDHTGHVNQVVEEEVSKALLAAAEHIAGMVQREIRNKGAVASGTLLGTTAPIVSGLSVSVGSPVEYGAYVEFGTRPHWPPYNPIRQWVELKKAQFTTLAIGVEFSSGRALPTRRGTRRIPKDREARVLDSIARAIQRKIAQRGTQGKFFMRDTLTSLGVRYEVAEGDNGMVYHVDVAGLLESLGYDIWGNINGRLS